MALTFLRTFGAGLSVGALLAAEAAQAGAWTQNPGAGQVISSVSRRAAPISSFAGGPADDDATFTSLFFEYGVIEGLTVGGTVFIEVQSMGSGGNTAELGIFLRKRFWQGEQGDVAAVQIGAKQPVNDLLGDSFGGPDSDPTQEVSLRLLYGRGFGFDWGNAFLSTEAGYHLQTDGDDDELRADITVGAQPWDCCMLLLSAYGTYPLGDADGAALKIAPSATYSFSLFSQTEDESPPKKTTLQLGLSQDLLNIDEGVGFQFSVWQPF
ncbi:MAG: hypothetical protein ACFBRM_02205 [Pikeienuella sp.]